MAISYTKTFDNIEGNASVKYYKIDFDSVTGGLIQTGLSRVISATYDPQTSDDHGIVYINSTTASETEDDPGDVYVDGVTANDIGRLRVVGH